MASKYICRCHQPHSLRSAHSLAPVAGYAPTLRSAIDALVLADYARHTGAEIPAENNGVAKAELGGARSNVMWTIFAVEHVCATTSSPDPSAPLHERVTHDVTHTH